VKIHELLDRDPRTGRLANNGQARITDTTDAATQQELRAELESFVCDGQFRRALQLILDRFLGIRRRRKQQLVVVATRDDIACQPLIGSEQRRGRR